MKAAEREDEPGEGREEDALAGLQRQLCIDPKMKDRVQVRNFLDPMRVCTCYPV